MPLTPEQRIINRALARKKYKQKMKAIRAENEKARKSMLKPAAPVSTYTAGSLKELIEKAQKSQMKTRPAVPITAASVWERIQRKKHGKT